MCCKHIVQIKLLPWDIKLIAQNFCVEQVIQSTLCFHHPQQCNLLVLCTLKIQINIITLLKQEKPHIRSRVFLGKVCVFDDHLKERVNFHGKLLR